MEENARLYNCLLCHQQVCICPLCDRGNVYCSPCASIARIQARRAAGRRYQNTPQGKLNHAKRQKKYRERQENKNKIVTHQGSTVSDISASSELIVQEVDIQRVKMPEKIETPCCHFCHSEVSSSLRTGFIHQSVAKRLCGSIWPTGP